MIDISPFTLPNEIGGANRCWRCLFRFAILGFSSGVAFS